MVERINMREKRTPLWHKLDEEITLWGRDALLRLPLINFAGDGLPLSVILNLLRVEFLLGERKELGWG